MSYGIIKKMDEEKADQCMLGDNSSEDLAKEQKKLDELPNYSSLGQGVLKAGRHRWHDVGN